MIFTAINLRTAAELTDTKVLYFELKRMKIHRIRNLCFEVLPFDEQLLLLSIPVTEVTFGQAGMSLTNRIETSVIIEIKFILQSNKPEQLLYRTPNESMEKLLP